MHFMKQMRLDPNFYFASEYDSDGTLRSMFWADARSREEYFVFSDVILFDVTHKTNKFMMPFADLHESVSCWYEMVSNNDATTKYIVGLCDEEKRKWWTVVYDELKGVTLKCECAKFETERYFCKHILRIMQERHLIVILEQYMLKRWTIGARYIMDSGVSTSKENENTVTPIMEWSLTALATKAAHKASNSTATYNEYRSWLNGFMGMFDELCLMDN
ncbi:hypothetical protein CFOL_v3_29852 [Cephalotus follicularis]|uniref:SWIM-type domain-containing protein n=1 Tax=Cephalotus follicularis TaxID=3775 RepID=A0A1Q3D1Y3_CEPFO|nr:hypothetical protein CFOL_v3_29852 [Cephalotus follicularis]